MSMTKLSPCVNLPLPEFELGSLINTAKDFALMNGLSKKYKEHYSEDQVQIVPFILTPTSFPKREFEKAVNIQTLLNQLMHKVAYDFEFLTETLKRTVEVDEFTSKLFNILEVVRKEGFGQDVSLGLLRSDYMLDGDVDGVIKQVELNTVSTSCAGFATAITKYHRYILPQLGLYDGVKNIPENNASVGLSSGLVAAWKFYNDSQAVILFVVEDVTYNICDQRSHEFDIIRLNPGIKVIRRNFSQLIAEAKLGPEKELYVGKFKVAVVYFRWGYGLDAFPTQREWDLRLLLERSRAIKCPSIHYHLAGTKKVQQALVQPGVLEKYLEDPKDVARVRELFTGLYALDFTPEGDEAVEMAIADPEKYVLKPQREGGGNNVYGLDISTTLKSLRNSQERTAWILMDRIHPPVQRNYLIRMGDSENSRSVQELVSELGIYGVVMGDQNGITVNTQVGHILRTKPSSANEGGIAMGAGAIDGPYLVS